MRKVYKDLGIIVLAAGMATGCTYDPEAAKTDNNNTNKNTTIEAEKSKEIIITGQIIDKLDESDHSLWDYSSVNWRLTTNHGPKLVTVCADNEKENAELKTAGMLEIGDMVQIKYRRSERKGINENTGHLVIRPLQISPISYESTAK